LRNQEGTAAKALEFTILTVARTNEVIGARLGEFNFGEKIWTVPRERMKAKRQHRIPLSREALRVLESTRPEGERVFELSNMAMLELLKRMGRNDLTVHGFRSTFRDWAAERTNYPREVVEAALAHVLSDKTEAAYRRGDLFEKRRRLMSEWGEVLLHSAVMSTILRSKQQRFVAEPWFV
jgi:integrase